jgi:threonine synthase
MARLMASLHRGRRTDHDSRGDLGRHRQRRRPCVSQGAGTRVVILYPDGRVSPTQEAQLTMFNGSRTNVRAYAVAGSFDDCHRLTRQAFADPDLRRDASDIGQLGEHRPAAAADGVLLPRRRAALATCRAGRQPAITSARRVATSAISPRAHREAIGLAVERFVAATNANDIVPVYLTTGRFEPRASVHTISNAMDVGNPSNFERMSWLYGGDADAMRRDIHGTCHTDDDVRETIRQVYETRGYLLDPHSAIAYMGARRTWRPA